MEFLPLLIIYCVLFIVGSLCLLYRDSALLCTGPIGALRQILTESVERIVPRSIQNVLLRLCTYLLYTRNCAFQLIFLVLCILAHVVWLVDMIPILYHHYPKHNHTLWPFVALFTNYFCWHKAWTEVHFRVGGQDYMLIYHAVLCGPSDCCTEMRHSVLNWQFCMSGDPGEIKPNNSTEYVQIYEPDGILYEGNPVCSTCQLKKPVRSKHCGICNRCVHRFDHHCIWTNNCVGGLNHRYFILFMVTLLAMFLQGIYVGSGCVLQYAEDIKLFQASFVDDDGSVKPMTISVAFQHLFMALPRLVFLVIALVVLTVLVSIFLSHHLYLIFTNQTTNERYKLQELQKKQADRSAPSSSYTNRNSSNTERTNTKVIHSKYRPFSKGMVNNFLEVFLPYNFMRSRIKRQ